MRVTYARTMSSRPRERDRSPAPSRAQTVGIVTGLVVTIVGAALTFRSRRGGFIMDIESAAPWAGALTLVGAVMLLLACWRVPSHYIGGPTVAIAAGVVVVIALVQVVVRTHWADVPADTIAGMVGLLIAEAALIVSGVRAWRRRTRRR